MKSPAVILLIVAFARVDSAKLSVSSGEDSSIASIASATVNGISSICGHLDHAANIILSSRFEENAQLQSLLHAIVSRISERQLCVYRVKAINSLQESKATMRLSVFLIDAGDVDETLARITSRFFNFRRYFVVALLNGNERTMRNLFDELWAKFIVNVNVVHCCRDGQATVTTFLPFRSERCSETTLVELTKASAFFPDKMSDLHGCPIIAATSLDADPCVYAKKAANGSVLPAGSDIRLIKNLAGVLNFRIEYNFTRTQGYLDTNGSAEGPFRLLLENKAHLAFDCYWLTKTRMTMLDSTAAYFNDYAILVVPPGQDLTPFEKLLYPFSWTVWAALCGCILVGLLVIFIMRLQREKLRKIIFGEKSRSPAMNLLSIVLIGNQHIWPRKLFARLVLLNFLVFTLNMRTIYQGAMFELMQSSKRHDEMKTIEEVKTRNFPIFVLKTTAEIFMHNENINASLEPVTSQKREQIMREIEDNPLYRGTLIMGKYKVLTRNFLQRGKNQLTMCNDRLMSISIVMYAPRNFFLLDKINEKISLFGSAGLLQHWHVYDRKMNTLEERKETQRLTLHQLWGLFQLVALGYAVSFCVFICEIGCRRVMGNH